MKKFKPENCIFAVTKTEGYMEEVEDFWCLTITPKAYWDKEKCCYDQHFGFTIPVPFESLQEGVFEGSTNDPQKLYEEALSYGFVWDLELNTWLKSLGGCEVYFPASAVSSKTASPQPASYEEALCNYETFYFGDNKLAIRPSHEKVRIYK